MLKYLFRVVSVFTAFVIICLSFLQLEENETEYPWHTQSNVSISFSRAQSSKSQIFDSIDQAAQQADTTVYLIKSDTKDAVNGTDLYWFGQRPTNFLRTTASIVIPYFKPERHGLLKRATPTMTQSLSGTYAVPTHNRCLVFQRKIKTAGGTIVHSCSSLQQSWWHVSFDVYSIVPLIFCALLLLGSAIAWAWIGLKPVSERIRRLSGFSPVAIAGQDCASFMSVFVLPAILTWLLVAAIVFPWRIESKYSLMFATMSGGTIALLLVIVTAFAFLFSLCLQPRIAQISTRTGNETLARYGSNCYKVICLIVVLLVLPMTAVSMSEAVAEYNSVAVWGNVGSAVGIQIVNSASQVDENHLWNVVAPRETRLYHEAVRQKVAALSYSAAATFTGSNSGSPDAKTTPVIPGGYDDIVLTDRNFLAALHISQSDLSKIPASKLDQSLVHTIHKYDELWLVKGARGSLCDNFYMWKGQKPFPAIAGDDSMGDIGKIKQDKNPLIVLVDDPTQLGKGIVDAALNGSNIFFTNRQVLDQLIRQYGLTGSVESVTSVADNALSQAQGAASLARNTGMALAICLLVIIFTSIQSSKIWARQRRRLIFMLHVSGQPFIEILRPRLLWDLGIVLVLGICCGFFDPQWKLLIAQPAYLLTPLLAFYLILETVTSLIAVRQAFSSVVRREE